MADLKSKPVPHDHAEFPANASKRPGFTEAYESLGKARRGLKEILLDPNAPHDLQIPKRGSLKLRR